MNKDVFEAFNIGNLSIPGKIIKFDQIEWSKHPTFEGVELKHIITGKQTEGQFSYHLVRIAPGKAIKNHIHETQLETHEVIAGTGVCINDGTELKYEVGVWNCFLYSSKFSYHHQLSKDEVRKNIFVRNLRIDNTACKIQYLAFYLW